MYAGQNAGQESDVEAPKDGRRIVARITIPGGGRAKITAVVNDQFKHLPHTEIIFIMMSVIISQQQSPGTDLGQLVRAILNTHPKLLQVQAEREAKIYSMEIISEEKVAEQDLETAMHGKKSFAVFGVPEE